MRLRFARTVVLIVLLACFLCPLVEMFDHWDHTIQTGNDTEYAFVVLAMCVGAAYSFFHVIVKLPVARYIAKIGFTSSVQIAFRSAQLSVTSMLFDSISPPCLELRI